MRWKKQILDLAPYQPGKSIDAVKREYGLEKIVKLASNENPFGCSKQALKVINEYNQSFALYPDGNATYIRAALAKKLAVKPSQLIFGNGSDENIQIISRALLAPGDNTVMSAHTFSQYKHNAIIDGAEIREIPSINGAHDLEAMLAAIDDRTNVVWVCNPNNPTGTYISEEALRSFINKVPKETLVVLDEAYFEYVVADNYPNSLQLVNEFENVIVLRTFSKIYGLASLRIGYGISNEHVIRSLEPVREPFNTSTVAQEAALAALEDEQFVETCKTVNREGLAQFYQFCEENDVSYLPSQGNFVLIDLKVDANEAFQFMLERGYIVRSAVGLGFPTSIRVTVGSKEQNDGVLHVLKEFLNR